MELPIVFFFAAVLIIGITLFAIITVAKGARPLDTTKYRTKWMQIERQLRSEDTASYSLSVLNADKLLDQALRERGVKGATMGERMKQTNWSNANAVWAAHKLRNQIAHDTDVAVSYDISRRALIGFKQALKDVGAI